MKPVPRLVRRIFFVVSLAILAMLLALVGLRALLFASWDREFENELAGLRQSGAKLDPYELAPARLPEDENAAAIYAGVFRSWGDTAEWHDIWPEDVDKLLEGKECDLKVVASWLKEIKTTFEQFETASRRSQSRYDIDYQNGHNALMPHITGILRASKMCRAAALVSARSNDAQETFRYLRLLIGLSQSLAGEPLLTSQLVRYVTINMFFETLKATRPELKPEQWRDLERLLKAITLEQDFALAFEGERAMGLVTLREFAFKGRPFGGVKDPYGWTLRGACKKDAAEFFRAMNKRVEFARRPFHQVRTEEQQYEALSREVKWYRVYTDLLLPTMKTHEALATAQAQVRIARAVCLFKSDGLMPDGTSVEDPFTGKPMTLERKNSGFTLSSAGLDQEYRTPDDIAFDLDR